MAPCFRRDGVWIPVFTGMTTFYELQFALEGKETAKISFGLSSHLLKGSAVGAIHELSLQPKVIPRKV
jgi:hypothetical protein